MNKKNESLKTIYKTAVEYFQKKDLKTAEIYCLKILSINSNHFNSISMLATIEAIKGNFEKAKELLTKGIEIEPNNVVAILNLGTAYKETGKLDEAISYYNKVLQLVPNHASAHYNLGLTFYKLRQIKKAKSYFKKTVDIQKNYAIAFFWLGNTHTELKEYNDAVSCYQKAIEINPNIVTAHNNLGLVFNNLNDFQSAITSFQNAVKKQPNHAGAHHNLALTFKNLGKLKEAINSHEMAMKYEPENLAHDYYLSEIKKEVLDSNLKNKINKILGNNKSNNITNVVFGNYLLAKYERKLKKYENEFEFLVKAHHNYFKSQKKKFDLGIKYCFDDVLQISEGVNVKKDGNEKYNKIKPIFIVGVPRCGSTLVEQIIGSGKKTISIGEETSVFENYVNKKILDKQSLNLGSVTEVRNELYNVYHQKGMLSKKYDYIFSDKSLNNFFYLELIKDIYPDAKIIHCKRDTLSSIMSIFQNNLTDLAWTHNLDHIFKYFDNYFRILEKYNEVYPNELYELEFEKLTINPEEESKKLMKFCQLPWDKSCLEFYKKKDLVSKTASNIQIREAIYQHSIKKYLPYKKFLDKHGKKYSWYN